MPLFPLNERGTIMTRETITSRKNPLLQHVRKLLSSRSYREQCGEYAADGIKLLEEAVKWTPDTLRTVLVTEDVDLPNLPEQVRLVEIPKDIMVQISPMEAPQGALFTCAMPEMGVISVENRCLILDGIQDPGNLGTILRTADAMEVPVVLTPGCADAYNHKTVRASMGAVFRSKPQWASHEAVAEFCKEQGLPFYVTALSDRAVDVRQANLTRAALVIGSEGKGVGEFFLSKADREVIIPMSSRCESLNAAIAAAIVLWEMKR